MSHRDSRRSRHEMRLKLFFPETGPLIVRGIRRARVQSDAIAICHRWRKVTRASSNLRANLPKPPSTTSLGPPLSSDVYLAWLLASRDVLRQIIRNELCERPRRWPIPRTDRISIRTEINRNSRIFFLLPSINRLLES